MIPAKIIEISDKVKVIYDTMLEPNPDDFEIGYDFEHEGTVYDEVKYNQAIHIYESSRTIAEVENVDKIKNDFFYYQVHYTENIGREKYYNTEPLYLNQSCFIEPTTEGKCKIVKI